MPLSFLPLLLSLPLLLLLLAPPPPALAQQAQPLIGQGVDPVSLGLVPGNQPIPVFVSLSVEQLSDINEITYTFSGVFTVVVTWRDPSVNLTGTVNLINFLGGDSVANQNSQAQNCTKWATIAGGTNVGDCASATANPGSSCSRPCFMATGYACCDSIWIPSISISNVLSISQDNIATDQLWLYGGTVGPANQDWSSVYRVVRVQGEFSNVFEFKKFPFDSQILKFQIAPVPPANFYIVPSMRGSAFLGPFGFVFQNSSKAFAPDIPFRYYHQSFGKTQVTGWETGSVNMCCGNSCAPSNTETTNNSTTYGIMTSTMAAGDPQQYFKNVVWNNPQTWASPSYTIPQGGLTCSVCIEISRKFAYYVTNDIIPVVLTGALAFTVVFARPDDLSVRLSTLVTLFLALVAIQFVIADQLPRTEYLTAFGALVLTSYILILVLIIESLVVFYISILEETYSKKQEAREARERKVAEATSTLMREADTGEDVEEAADGAPPQRPMAAQSYRSMRGSKSVRFSIFRPFMFSEEKLMAMLGSGDEAFQLATRFDNFSLLILGIGYIIAAVLVFVLFPQATLTCTA